MFMDQISQPAGRVQSPSAPQEGSATRQGQQEPDALDAPSDSGSGRAQSEGETRHVATNSGDAGIAPHRSAGRSEAAAAIPTLESDTASPKSPTIGAGSLATTAVSSPASHRRFLPAPEPRHLRSQSRNSNTMPFVVGLAQIAAFTDVFLSGLVIPLIPSILETRTHIPRQQVQIWASVLVSAYGGAFAVVSPLMPLLTRRGPSLYAVLLAGLACAAAAFALLQLSSRLHLLILARGLQGLSAAAITAACSRILATEASTIGRTDTLASFTPALFQNTAMTLAPMISGFVHDWYNVDNVFYFAYALVALNILLTLAAATLAPRSRPAQSADEVEQQSRGYGTIPSPERSGRSSRSVSPTSLPAARLDLPHATAWSLRLVVALYGYLVVGLLTSALQSALPVFVRHHFHWNVAETGVMFVPLSAPATLVGLVSGALAIRVPKSARFVTALGFLASVPAFLYLGGLKENTEPRVNAFILTLSGLSFAIGLCGDPLVREITNAVGPSGSDSWSTNAQATSLPNLANAWGTLAGPLFAGAISWVSGWETMTRSLALVAAGSGVVSFFFLQGWIRSPSPDVPRPRETSSDEESAPLLAHDHSTRSAYVQPTAYANKKADTSTYSNDSDDVSPHTRNGKHRSHRRHFSVDNFSVATTAGPGSLDSSTSSVRFQAALETPAHGSAAPTPRRPPTIDSRTSAERRYVMREAPHAPATDPLLAAGSLYVIDEERDTAQGVESARQKRRVVVFAEGTAPPDLLERHRHHVVAINALDGTAQMVSNSADDHSVHVTEGDGDGFEEAASRRYVVVVVEEDE